MVLCAYQGVWGRRASRNSGASLRSRCWIFPAFLGAGGLSLIAPSPSHAADAAVAGVRHAPHEAAGPVHDDLSPVSKSQIYGPTLDEGAGRWTPIAQHDVTSIGPSSAFEPASGTPGAGWTFERLLREIVSKNPRIRAQNASAQAAQYDVALARWQYFPTPSVQAESFGLDRQVTASLSQPLLSFGRLSTDVKAAQRSSAGLPAAPCPDRAGAAGVGRAM